MAHSERKTLRCAIYTRKSSEHGLEQDFNSLDAQREAAEAYIKSQAHEGWRLVKAHYDDGGLSGGTLERPALQALLADIRTRKIDVVVVYKVDRLTRSLADFAKLVELFEAEGVSFVSVTQQFNTTTSMGRLTLNVLLSFAQFEREIAGERIRDKFAASRRKGMWMGGTIPLGYDVRDRKLVVNPGEATRVRLIFRRYLALGCVSALRIDLDGRGIRSKQRVLTSGLLGNRTTRRTSRVETALLSGLIFDDRGNLMSPSYTVRRRSRYRYYISSALLRGRKQDAGSIARVAADDVERIVVAALGRKQGEPAIDTHGVWNSETRKLVRESVERVALCDEGIHLTLKTRQAGPAGASEGDDNDDEPLKILKLPLPSTRPRARKEMILPGGPSSAPRHLDHSLILALARARSWMRDLKSGNFADTTDIARCYGLSDAHVRRVLRVGYLAPDIVEAVVEGRQPRSLTVKQLLRGIPRAWPDQRSAFGFGR